eukprot:757130-Pelagomonas_calceolata.AAC.3
MEMGLGKKRKDCAVHVHAWLRAKRNDLKTRTLPAQIKRTSKHRRGLRDLSQGKGQRSWKIAQISQIKRLPDRSISRKERRQFKSEKKKAQEKGNKEIYKKFT